MKHRLGMASKYIPLLATAAVLAGLYVAGLMRYENFGQAQGLVNLVRNNALLGVVAIGSTFVILSGGIDLSVGGVVAFTCMFIAASLPSGVQVVVNASNPVSSLTVDQAAGIYKGEITNWKEVGGADLPIRAVSREKTSPQTAKFMQLAMGPESHARYVETGEAFPRSVRYATSDSDVRQRVEDNPGTIGLVDLYYRPADVKVLTLDGQAALKSGLDPELAILIVLAAAILFGAAQGCLIHFFELPPFLVTLAGMFLARGAAFVVQTSSIAIKHPFFLQTVNEQWVVQAGDITLHFVIFLLLAVMAGAMFLAHYTRFGRAVYALGGNETSAKLMGLPIGWTKVRVYTLAAFCSALGGVIWTFELQSGDPLQGGLGLEMDAIAAVVIGGTLLSGGVGFVAGTVMGVLIFGLIKSIITFENLNSWWTKIVVGLLVLAFILLQNFIAKASMRKK